MTSKKLGEGVNPHGANVFRDAQRFAVRLESSLLPTHKADAPRSEQMSSGKSSK
jgi:hypothetical protein